MGTYQNPSVNSDSLIIGNYKIQVATTGTTIASGSSAWTNLGAGIVDSFSHNFEAINVQAGNAVDPLDGIANETFVISGSLIEYSAAEIVSAWGGLITTLTATTTTKSTISAGGKTTLTPKAVLLTNKRIVAGASVETNILVYRAYMTNGPQFTAKSDNDTDPINTISFELRGEIDGSRTVGDQLYCIEKWLD